MIKYFWIQWVDFRKVRNHKVKIMVSNSKEGFSVPYIRSFYRALKTLRVKQLDEPYNKSTCELLL